MNKERDSYEMTQEELWQEEVYDKIQRHEYIVEYGDVIDFETGEVVCSLKLIKPIFSIHCLEFLLMFLILNTSFSEPLVWFLLFSTLHPYRGINVLLITL